MPTKRHLSFAEVLLSIVIVLQIIAIARGIHSPNPQPPGSLDDVEYQAELSGRAFNRLLGEAMLDIADDVRGGIYVDDAATFAALQSANEDASGEASEAFDELVAELAQTIADDPDSSIELADVIEAAGRGRIAASKP